MHFFIDPTNLSNQTSAEKYGPVDGFESLKFQVTSKFTSGESAFACESGLMIVQQSDEDPALVNIILEPLNSRSKVKYYIYRGISKLVLIKAAGDKIVDPNPTNIELINRIYDSIAGVISYTANILGFDNNVLSGDTNIKEIFYSNSDFRAIPVIEGVAIGEFVASKGGFEIVLETDKINIDLNYLRKADHVIDVTGLSGLELKAAREQILAYIDPTAFFGSYHSIGVSVSSYAGQTKTTVSKKDSVLFNDVLSRFYTKNTFYLDIRSDKGYSYNFYGDYNDGSGNSIQFSSSPEAYETHGWPIIIKQNVTSLPFRLRTDGNSNPLIYVEQVGLKETNKKSVFFDRVIDSAYPGWTKIQSLIIPFQTLYVQMYYFHQEIEPTSANPFVKSNRYYNNAFCSVDLLPEDLATANKKDSQSSNRIFIKEKLQTNGSAGFGYTATSGAYWDNSRIIFYSELLYQLQGSGRRFSPSNLSELKLDNSAYSNKFNSKLGINCLLFKKFISQNNYEDIKVLSVNSYIGIANRQEVENILFLGLSRSEMSAVKLFMANISGKHHKYFFLEPTANIPLTNKGEDDKQNFFYEYRLKIQGLDSNGNLQYVTPILNSSEILIYSRDNFFFNSKAFSLPESVTVEISNEIPSNNIEYHIYPNGEIEVKNQKQLVEGGKFADYYYHSPNVDPVMICRLPIVETTEKAKPTAVPTSIILPPPPNIVKDTIEYNQDGVYAEKTYILEDNSVITYGQTKEKKPGQPIQKGYKYYQNLNKITHMVFFDQSQITGNHPPLPNINFIFQATLRLYMQPNLAAGFIGALITMTKLNYNVISQGSSYIDGSCFPSALHVNGEAIDLNYAVADTEGKKLIIDSTLINTMYDFGFHTIYIGKNIGLLGPYFEKLKLETGNKATYESGHNFHIHFHNFKINGKK